MRVGRKIAAVALGAALLLSGTLRYAQAEVDFAGKTVTILVPFARGGETDLFAHFWGPLIADKLAGKPKLKIVNEPGAGSTTGANNYHKNAKNDGLSMLATSASTMYAYLLGNRRVKYSYDSWVPVLIEPIGGVVYAHPSVAKTGAPAKFRGNLELQMHVPNAAHLGMLLVLVLEMLGENYTKPVFGRGGGINAFHSFRDGLVNVDMQNTMSYHRNVKQLVKKGTAIPMFSFGKISADGTIARDPSFPELPTFEEYYRAIKEKQPSGEIYKLWKTLLLAGFPLQKILLLPKSTAPEILEAYEEAANKVVADAKIFAHDANSDSDYQPVVGKQAQLLLESSMKIDPDTLSWYRDWVKEKFDLIL